MNILILSGKTDKQTWHFICKNKQVIAFLSLKNGCGLPHRVFSQIISLYIRSMWETTVMHKQVSGWTVNFGPNFPESPFMELKTGITPPPPFRKTSDLGWPKFTREYPPPHFRKLQIWEDQSLLWNTPQPPPTPPQFQKTSDLGWPKFTPEYPPIENCHRVQVRDFLNTKIYYMWRLYPTRITAS